MRNELVRATHGCNVVVLSVLAATALLFGAWPHQGYAEQQAAAKSKQENSGARTDWATYNGDVTGDHYSPLNQITTDNVQRLKQVWRFDAGDAGCGVQAPATTVWAYQKGGESASVADEDAVAELIPLPSGYPALLEELKTRIRAAQLPAALTLNQETIQLYWSIRQDLSSRFAAEGWGTKVVDRLAKDLGREFPGVEGFSLRNLRYMRSFAEAWPDPQILQLAAKLPWGHHMVLLDRLKDGQSREWYLRPSIEHGWSRNVLTHHISTQLREREGKALTNFSRTSCKRRKHTHALQYERLPAGTAPESFAL